MGEAHSRNNSGPPHDLWRQLTGVDEQKYKDEIRGSFQDSDKKDADEIVKFYQL